MHIMNSSYALLLNILAKETYLLFLGQFCILMRSPCTNGHSPWLIALLANYRPLAPDPVPSPSMDPALIKYRQLSHSGTREYWNITVENMHWPYSSNSIKWVIYCSKLNQRLISDLRSETSDGQQLCKYREDSDTPS